MIQLLFFSCLSWLLSNPCRYFIDHNPGIFCRVFPCTAQYTPARRAALRPVPHAPPPVPYTPRPRARAVRGHVSVAPAPKGKCIRFYVKGGVKPDHWGGVKVDQLSMEKI